ncbi:MAG: hypothetical protein MJZ21_04560, partial [archaeon]|nr:hypothetical protein [archaeon]
MNEPDGFIGAVMAMEGITDATALLHGQNGCRKGLILSQKMCPRTDRDTDIPVYNGNPTVPYSNINQGDYTGKSYGKLQKAAQYVADEDYNLTALICSPGISIVGDDCARILRESNMPGDTMVLDSSDMGENVWTGFDKTIRACLGKVCTENLPIRKNTVVVTGLSIMHKDWASFEEELTEMLGAMGLKIICFAGAGCTVQDLKDSVGAEYCIDISPEFSTETRSFYKDNGTKVISYGCSPVGFDSVEGFYRNIT